MNTLVVVESFEGLRIIRGKTLWKIIIIADKTFCLYHSELLKYILITLPYLKKFYKPT